MSVPYPSDGEHPPQFGPHGLGSPDRVPATAGARTAARIIDGVLLTIVTTVLGAAIVAIDIDPEILESGDLSGVQISFGAALAAQVVTAAVFVGYFTLLEGLAGTTLGKALLRLRVRGPDGGKPTLGEALRRNAWLGLIVLNLAPIAFGPIGLGHLAVIAAGVSISQRVSRDQSSRLGWHDAFAGTQVVTRR